LIDAACLRWWHSQSTTRKQAINSVLTRGKGSFLTFENENRRFLLAIEKMFDFDDATNFTTQTERVVKSIDALLSSIKQASETCAVEIRVGDKVG